MNTKRHKTVGAIATANVLVKKWLGLEFLEDTVKNAGNSQLQEIDASGTNLRSNNCKYC